MDVRYQSVHEIQENPHFGLEILGEGVEIVPLLRLQEMCIPMLAELVGDGYWMKASECRSPHLMMNLAVPVGILRDKNSMWNLKNIIPQLFNES